MLNENFNTAGHSFKKRHNTPFITVSMLNVKF